MSRPKFPSRKTFAFSTLVTALAATHAAATLPPLQGVQLISAKNGYTCAAVNSAGLCWGDNGYAQLGDGTSIPRGSPTPVRGLGAGVSAIAAGYFHSCAIVNGGPLCWGYNNEGELGDGSTTSSATPVAVVGINSGTTALALSFYQTCGIINGGVQCWGPTPGAITGLESGVTAISAGFQYTCAIVSASAKCWGVNNEGEFGDGTTTSSNVPVAVATLGSGVTAISAGPQHACAIVAGGAWCWAENSSGELGNGTTTSSTVPVAVVGLGSHVVEIAAGGTFTCARVDNDSVHPVKCWGNNSAGELGNGMTANSATPVSVTFPFALGGSSANQIIAISAGLGHACARAHLGGQDQMYCWGDNSYGELAVRNGGAPVALLPVAVATIGTASAVTAGGAHTCAIVSGGAKCWGDNSFKELGNGTSSSSATPSDVSGLGSGVTAIAAGGVLQEYFATYFSCALAQGSAQCWGENFFGQLGNGTTTDSALPVPVTLGPGVSAIATGREHACALLDGAVECWGANFAGQLGNGSTAGEQETPVAVTGLASSVSAIVTGGAHTCALANGGALCWGFNFDGELGDGSTSDSYTPIAVTGLNSGVTAIGAGAEHSCAIVNGSVMCWGDNTDGQLGDGTTTASLVPVAVAGIGAGVTSIATGSVHSCAVSNGNVWCWGANLSGQLGDGSAVNKATPVQVRGLASAAMVVTAGVNHTCALLQDGSIQCWGDDISGELGDGRYLYTTTPQPVVFGDEIFADGLEGN